MTCFSVFGEIHFYVFNKYVHLWACSLRYKKWFFSFLLYETFKAYLASSINVSFKRNEQNHFCILGNKPRGKHIYWKHKNEFPPKQSDTWTSHINKLIFISLPNIKNLILKLIIIIYLKLLSFSNLMERFCNSFHIKLI